VSLFVLVADSGNDATGSQPVASAVVTSRSVAGTCVGSTCTVSAAVATVITCSPTHDSQYSLKLYENGVFVQSGSTAGFTYTKTYTGYTVSGGSPFVDPDLTYRADVVRTSDSVVVSSKTGNHYTDEFGTCGGPH
jgi:hypothetical protein